MRRRWLNALASFESLDLAERGVEFAMKGEVPLQDVAAFASALFLNRTTRPVFWKRLRDGFGEYVARLANAPMLVRRVVESFGLLVERSELEEAEEFLAKNPLPQARQAIAQTIERLREDVALRERSQKAIGTWLAARTR